MFLISRCLPLLAGAAAILVASNANASIVTSVSQTTPNAGAITDDANLANRVTNFLNVTVATGFDWTNSEIKLQLTQGTVYNATNAVGTESSPVSAFWGTTSFRNGEFDTFVNSKGVTSATALGQYPDDGVGTAKGLSTNGATLVSVAWGNTVAGEDGTFSIGRFTLSSDAVGTFVGRSRDSQNPGVPFAFSGNISAGVLSVPEPASLSLLGLGGLTMLRRRRA